MTHPPARCARAALAALSVLAAALAGCATAPPGGTGRVAVPGATIAYSRSGQGGVAVVLQSGLGDDRTPWAAVVQGLQASQRVLAYDRPGYGHSSATDRPRDPCTVAAEMRSLLAASGLQPPYVLVGHSLGGLYQYVYARLYPDDAAGLLLLDPTHPRHWQSLQQQAPAAAAALKLLRATAFTATARREFDQQADCLDRVERLPARPVPTVVMVSTRPGPGEGPDYQRMVAALRDDWLRLTGAPALVAVPGAGHYLQREAPQAVERELRGLLSAAAGR